MKTPVAEAKRAGAVLHRRTDGRWVCLDMDNTPLWTLTFDTIHRAARAFLAWRAKHP